MMKFPRHSLVGFMVLAVLGVVFIASANRSHDETAGLVLGEQIEDPLGDVTAPEGLDVISAEPEQLPENMMKESKLPESKVVEKKLEIIPVPKVDAVDVRKPTDAREDLVAESDPNGKKIVIHLSSQTMDMVEHGVVLSTFKISSGKRGMQTPTGTFKVLNKNKRAYSKTYGLYMPYWMAFTTRGHGIHELPEWPNGYKEGENHLGTPVSHGCVRLGVGSAQTMFEWAEVGTPIEVVQS